MPSTTLIESHSPHGNAFVLLEDDERMVYLYLHYGGEEGPVFPVWVANRVAAPQVFEAQLRRSGDTVFRTAVSRRVSSGAPGCRRAWGCWLMARSPRSVVPSSRRLLFGESESPGPRRATRSSPGSKPERGAQGDRLEGVGDAFVLGEDAERAEELEAHADAVDDVLVVEVFDEALPNVLDRGHVALEGDEAQLAGGVEAAGERGRGPIHLWRGEESGNFEERRIG